MNRQCERQGCVYLGRRESSLTTPHIGEDEGLGYSNKGDQQNHIQLTGGRHRYTNEYDNDGLRRSPSFRSYEEDWSFHSSGSAAPIYSSEECSRNDSLLVVGVPLASNRDSNYIPRIEIIPGMKFRLRGANETWEAIQRDFFIPATCTCCTRTIFCIQDADYVICPACRVVNPLAQSPISHQSDKIGGVGLGFEYEDLACWQRELMKKAQHEQTCCSYEAADNEHIKNKKVESKTLPIR